MRTSLFALSCKSACLICETFVFFIVAAVGASAQTPGWTAVHHGFSPEVLLNHGQGMWAAGGGGSISLSVDGGQHWQKKHEDASDGLLLDLAFANEKFGVAAGTGKHLLLTDDGGETWKSFVAVPETVFQAAFADAKHGVIRTR